MALLPHPMPQADTDNQDLARNLRKARKSFSAQGSDSLHQLTVKLLSSLPDFPLYPLGVRSRKCPVTKQEPFLSECLGGILGDTLEFFI